MSGVLITGGTGNTGRVLSELLRDRAEIKVASRNPEAGNDEHVFFDWHDPESHDAALSGVDRVYLVPPIGDIDPMPAVGPFLEKAKTAGVRRVAMLGSSMKLPGAPGMDELYVAVGRIPEYAILRPSWFMQNLAGPHAGSIREWGEVVAASGPGRIGWIAAGDIAAAAAAVLLDPNPVRAEHVLTGPEALSYADIATALSEVTGRPIRFVDVSVEELTDRHVGAGIPAGFAAALASMDAEIRAGAEDRTTTAVEDLTGRPPRSFRDFARDHRTAWIVDAEARTP